MGQPIKPKYIGDKRSKTKPHRACNGRRNCKGARAPRMYKRLCCTCYKNEIICLPNDERTEFECPCGETFIRQELVELEFTSKAIKESKLRR